MDELPAISVQPGELYLARTPTLVRTILGSCISVTFWTPRLRAGALCHGVLPNSPPGLTLDDGSRYVDFSIRYLARQFDALGASRRELEIKIFGGADVLPVSAPSSKPTIGCLNCETALRVLAEEGFHVLASDTGGTRGRIVHFDTGTGEVLVRRLATMKTSL